MLLFFSKFSTQSMEVCLIYVSHIIRFMLDNDIYFESLHNSSSAESDTDYITELYQTTVIQANVRVVQITKLWKPPSLKSVKFCTEVLGWLVMKKRDTQLEGQGDFYPTAER